MRPLRRILLVRTNLLKARAVPFTPLGCMHLASAVRAWLNPDIDIRIVDMGAARLNVADLSRILKEHDPDVVGFSSLSHEYADLVEAVRLAKEWKPDCLTVVGGPHASMFADILAPEPEIDVVVRGEGEHTFVELLQAWSDGDDFDTVPGLVFYRDGELVETGARPFESDLDSLPFPAWDLIDIEAYPRWAALNGTLAASPQMAVITSRACPFRCIYCHRLFGTKFRARSVDNVMEELDILRHKYAVREIHFVDDCFNLRQARALEIAREMVAHKFHFKISFPNGIRSDSMGDELLLGLKEAGCYMMYFAVETVSERLQQLSKKRLDLDKAQRAIDRAYELKIIPGGFFMLGFPSETRAEMEDTVRFACESKILKSYFFNVVPFPRTELWDMACDAYPEMPRDPADISKVYNYWSTSEFYTQATGIDIAAVLRDAYRRFYVDPVRAARILRLFPKNIHLLRGALWGFQVWFPAIERLNALRFSSRVR